MHREKLYDENLLVLASAELPLCLLFCMLWIDGKHNFRCKLRYLEAPKQTHLSKHIFPRTRNNPNNKNYLSEP